MRMFSKGKPFMNVLAEGSKYPVFSETFLYPKVGKTDARFILGVANEYSRLIEKLGTEKVKEILQGEKEDI